MIVNLDTVYVNEAFEQRAKDIAASMVKRMVRERKLHSSNSDDAEQEILLGAARALPKYDSRKGEPLPFIQGVIAREARRVRRDMRSARWSWPPLEECDFEGIPCGEPEGRWMREVDFRCDLAGVASLNAEDRMLLMKLQVMSKAELARELGVHRATVSRRVVKLRNRVLEAGICPPPRNKGCRRRR